MGKVTTKPQWYFGNKRLTDTKVFFRNADTINAFYKMRICSKLEVN